MKPKRSFVVEYKINRRQLKTRSKSIWGNTDLKALAEEIEGETSSPSGIPLPLGTPSADRADIPLEPAPSVPVADSGPPDDLERPQLPDEATAEAPRATEPFERLTRESAQKSKSPRAQRNAVRRRKASAAPDPPAPTAETNIRDSLQRPDIVTQAELADLDTENKRLRAMLAETLRDQNVKLKAMLRRFGDA